MALDTSTMIGAIAALIKELQGDQPTLSNILVNWLTKSSEGGVGVDIRVHRAVIATLSTSQGETRSDFVSWFH